MKIKKNDNVFIISGKDKGKNGQVQKVISETNQLVVTGINLSKRHLKPSNKNPHGGIVDVTSPINVSNVNILCPHCGRPTRVAKKITAQAKERVCRKCGGNLDAKAQNVKS